MAPPPDVGLVFPIFFAFFTFGAAAAKAEGDTEEVAGVEGAETVATGGETAKAAGDKARAGEAGRDNETAALAAAMGLSAAEFGTAAAAGGVEAEAETTLVWTGVAGTESDCD